MTEEERIEKEKQDAIEAAKAEALAKVEEEAKTAKDAMTAELQAERQRRQAAEEELKIAKGEQKPLEESDPKKVFEDLLKERDQESAKANKAEALAEFKNSVKEFSPENDEAGIVFSAFERELRKFNLDGLATKADFTKRFKEVHEFMERNKQRPSNQESFYKGGQENTGSEPKEGDSANLSDVELKLIKDMNWDKERYLKQKAARPHYVASLLQYRS